MGRPLTSGFAEGIQANFGEYRECLNINSPKTDNKPVINGQYCMVKAIMPFPPVQSLDMSTMGEDRQLYSGLLDHYGLTRLSTVRSFVEALNLSNGTLYRMGMCLPHVCSAQEWQHLLNTCESI